MDLYYIYKITNNITGKTYIGQHKYVLGGKRQRSGGVYTDNYESLLTDGYWGSGVYLKKAYKKYGKENFTKDILVSHLECKEAADEAEKVFIKCYRELGKELYNLTDGGDGSLGHKHTEESRRKMSEATKGNKYNLGRHPTEETRQKLSEVMKGRRWFNNGKENVRAYECPDGFTAGRYFEVKIGKKEE